MAGKITDYPTMTTLASGDLLDVSDYDGVSAFVSKSIDWDILKTNIESQITFTNLYTANGTLSGFREVEMGVNDMVFKTTGDANLLRLDSTSDNIGIGTAAPGAKLEVAGNTIIGAVAQGNPLIVKDYLGNDMINILRNSSSKRIGIGDVVTNMKTTVFGSTGDVFEVSINGTNPYCTIGGDPNADGYLKLFRTGVAEGARISLATDSLTDTYFDIIANFGIGTSTPTEKLDVAGKAKISSQLGIGSSPAMNTYFEIDDGVADHAARFVNLGSGIGLQFKRAISNDYVGEIYPDILTGDQVLVYNSRSGHRFRYNGAEIMDMNEVSGEARVRINEPTVTSGALSIETKTSGGGSAFYGVNSASNTSTSTNTGVWGESKGTGGTATTNVGGYFTATGGTTANYALNTDGNINMANIPTSSAGLSAGDIWNNSGVLSIV